MSSRSRTLILGAVGGAWVLSLGWGACGAITVGDWNGLEQVLVNAAAPATVLVALWPRTTHPSDAWEGGIEEGRRLEREAMDCHPRSGQLRVVR